MELLKHLIQKLKLHRFFLNRQFNSKDCNKVLLNRKWSAIPLPLRKQPMKANKIVLYNSWGFQAHAKDMPNT